MNVKGVGTDIIECERIDRMIKRHSDHFVQRVYTEHEIRYCTDRKNADQHFAGRWAAKEAVLKALGTGWISGIAWTDVEVGHAEGGRPIILLHGGAAKVAREQGIRDVQISITHCKSHAVAFALALSD